MPRKFYVPMVSRRPGKGKHMDNYSLKQMMLYACQYPSPAALEKRFGCSHGTAVRFVRWIKQNKFTLEQLGAMTPTEISTEYYKRKNRTRFNAQGQKIETIKPDLETLNQLVADESKRNGTSRERKLRLTQKAIIEQYYLETPANLALVKQGTHALLSLSRVEAMLKAYRDSKVAVAFRKNHSFGQDCQYDFTGVTLPYGDRKNPLPATFMLGVLPASGYTFVEAIASQKQQDVMPCFANSFKFFGGVPRCLRIDNFKAAVSGAGKFGGVLTADMEALARFFGVDVYACRSGEPTDKGCVEAHVKIVTRYALALANQYIRLGGWFNSLQELNEFIKPLVEKINNRRIRGMAKTRKEIFELEKEYLKKPASWDYEYAQAVNFTVPPTARYTLNEHEYALPPKWIDLNISVELTADRVTFASGPSIIVTYKRQDWVKGLSAMNGFLPEEHEMPEIYNIPTQDAMLLQWANAIGQHVELWVRRMLSTRIVYRDKIRLIVHVLKLSKGFCARNALLDDCVKEQLAQFGMRTLPAQRIINEYGKLTLPDDMRRDEIHSFEQYVAAGKRVLSGESSLMLWSESGLNERKYRQPSKEYLNGSAYYRDKFANVCQDLMPQTSQIKHEAA